MPPSLQEGLSLWFEVDWEGAVSWVNHSGCEGGRCKHGR